MKSQLFIILLGVLIIGACRPLPKVKYRQFDTQSTYKYVGDSLDIYLENPLMCPLTFTLTLKDSVMLELLDRDFPFVLPALSDTLLRFYTPEVQQKIGMGWKIGDATLLVDTSVRMSLPFPKNRSYKIVQGYHGKFSHNSSFSRYAIDFNMKIGDTVTVADSGYVVGVTDQYQYGGKNRKWRDYANYITVYHPHSKYFTQYVHLKKDGSMVNTGDYVRMGQVIGLSGMTGFTNVEHLHFNVLKATEEGVISTKMRFKEGYNGEKLKKGNIVKK